MSGAGQETMLCGTYRTVHEGDTAILRCVSVRLRSRAAFSSKESPGSSSLYTRIPNFTSWRSLWSLEQWQEQKAVGKDVLQRGGAYCTSFPGVAQQRPPRASWDEWTRGATSAQSIGGPKISRRPITTCVEAEGEMVYCSPLLLPTLPPPRAQSPTISETD